MKMKYIVEFGRSLGEKTKVEFSNVDKAIIFCKNLSGILYDTNGDNTYWDSFKAKNCPRLSSVGSTFWISARKYNGIFPHDER